MLDAFYSRRFIEEAPQANVLIYNVVLGSPYWKGILIELVTTLINFKNFMFNSISKLHSIILHRLMLEFNTGLLLNYFYYIEHCILYDLWISSIQIQVPNGYADRTIMSGSSLNNSFVFDSLKNN